jgi:hypothetical protein
MINNSKAGAPYFTLQCRATDGVACASALQCSAITAGCHMGTARCTKQRRPSSRASHKVSRQERDSPGATPLAILRPGRRVLQTLSCVSSPAIVEPAAQTGLVREWGRRAPMAGAGSNQEQLSAGVQRQEYAAGPIAQQPARGPVQGSPGSSPAKPGVPFTPTRMECIVGDLNAVMHSPHGRATSPQRPRSPPAGASAHGGRSDTLTLLCGAPRCSRS